MQSFRNRIRHLALPALVAVALAGLVETAQADEPLSSYRRYDAQGRFAGTARPAGDSTLRFYDGSGRFAGTARRQGDGSWRTYGAKGEFTGTVRRQPR